MKKMLALTSALALYCWFGAKKVSAWSGVTHEDITKKAILLLEKEKKFKPAAFYKDYHTEILKGCTEPDGRGDIDRGTGLHYYSCVNPKGKELPLTNGYYRNRLGKLSKSARTMMEENYTCAVSLYKSGDIKNAMRVLGRAIHFLSDIGCTVHVANMKYSIKPKNVHHALEKHISTTCAKFTAESFDKRLLKYYENDSFEDALHKLAKSSAKFVDIINHLDPRAFDDTAKVVLPNIQQNVTALLLKFYDDCCNNNGNFLQDKKLYSLKNAASGLVLTVSPKCLTLEKPEKELEQKLEICLLNDGNFGLKTEDGRFVSGNCRGYSNPKASGEPALFRAAALGKRQFRITSESDGYTKIMTNTKTGKIAFSDFDPKNPAQVWIIN